MRDFILSNIKKQIHNVESNDTYWVESRLAIQSLFELAKRMNYINQEWIDSRIDYSNVERLKDLYKTITIFH
jgi:hypothetical protein